MTYDEAQEILLHRFVAASYAYIKQVDGKSKRSVENFVIARKHWFTVEMGTCRILQGDLLALVAGDFECQRIEKLIKVEIVNET